MAILVANALDDVRLGDAVGQFRGHRARRDDRRPDVVGLHFLAQSFGQRARGMLGRAVNHAAGDNLVADRR